LLPAGTFGRGEMIVSISALSLALKGAASAAYRSTIQTVVGKSSWTSCFSIMAHYSEIKLPLRGAHGRWSNCSGTQDREEAP